MGKRVFVKATKRNGKTVKAHYRNVGGSKTGAGNEYSKKSSHEEKMLGTGQFHANKFDAEFKKLMSSGKHKTYGDVAKKAFDNVKKKHPNIKHRHLSEWSHYAGKGGIKGVIAAIKK